jgi:hypothetical protein
MTGRAEWTIDRHSTALFVIASALVVALFTFLQKASVGAKWLQVQGTARDTRIVADHGVETKWGGELTWRAEYRVAYPVASRESEAGVRLALPQLRPLCRVRYNPKKPEVSTADCR